MKRLRDTFAEKPKTEHEDAVMPQEFHQLVDGIEDALSTFEAMSNDTVMRHFMKGDRTPQELGVDEEGSAYLGNDNEHVLLVYL